MSVMGSVNWKRPAPVSRRDIEEVKKAFGGDWSGALSHEAVVSIASASRKARALQKLIRKSGVKAARA